MKRHRCRPFCCPRHWPPMLIQLRHALGAVEVVDANTFKPILCFTPKYAREFGERLVKAGESVRA